MAFQDSDCSDQALVVADKIHERVTFGLSQRDGDKRRYLGKGTLKAVANVNDVIAPKLAGRSADDWKAIAAKWNTAASDLKSNLRI